jgi:hypothetical protein
MGRRVTLLAALTLVAAAAVVLVGSAGATPRALPTLNVALTGTTGVSISGSKVSGAVSIVSTFAGSVPRGEHGVVRARPSESWRADPAGGQRCRAPTVTSTP